jgi:hypothetical protein
MSSGLLALFSFLESRDATDPVNGANAFRRRRNGEMD